MTGFGRKPTFCFRPKSVVRGTENLSGVFRNRLNDSFLVYVLSKRLGELLMNKFQLLPILGLALLIAGCDTNAAPKETITLYKSYTCGCCNGWKDHMRSNGYKVNVVNMEDKYMPAIKRKYGISSSLKSCHTAIIGDYIVEGHIPSKVVDKLLTEKPAIDGIAMADMPSGSPGMPGSKNETWKIYSFKNDKISMYDEL